MGNRNFRKMLEAQWEKENFVCVGLDSDYEKIPDSISLPKLPLRKGTAIWKFNRFRVEATKDLVCAYKPNTAFYEEHGDDGWDALKDTIRCINELAPEVPVIIDAKRGDIENTNNGYVKMAFDYLKADAITVHPYLGKEALQPFLDCADKGIIVLCRTSNKGAGEFQDRIVEVTDEEAEQWGLPRFTLMPLYQLVAYRVSREWNVNGNCALVVGATYPEELAAVRQIVGDMPILIPAVGAQGGDVEKAVKAGKDSRGKGMIINSSRGIIFAESPGKETIKLRDLINQYR